MNPSRIYSAIGHASHIHDFLTKLTGYEKSVKFFVSHLNFNRQDTLRVLEVGCGTGLYSLAVLDRFSNAQVTAFDLNKKLAGHLKNKAQKLGYGNRIKTFTADVRKDLDAINGKFDLIIAAGVLEYVPLKPTVEKLSRLLLVGGYFLISPVKNNWWGNTVAKIYATKAYSRHEHMDAFANKFSLEQIITLPKYTPASFKEALVFKKLRD